MSNMSDSDSSRGAAPKPAGDEAAYKEVITSFYLFILFIVYEFLKYFI